MRELVYSSQDICAAEEPLLARGVPLMARASWALAQFSLSWLRTNRSSTLRWATATGARVCVLAGPGNNAGDALFAAAVLARQGVAVTAVRLFDRTHDAGLRAARRASVLIIDGTARADQALILDELLRADLVLDGILGTGGRSGLPDHITALIRSWNHTLARTDSVRAGVIAVDMPSDLQTDDVPEERLHADHTITFGGLKAELIDPRVRRFTGTIHVIDIGLGLEESTNPCAEVLAGSELAARFPRPAPADHKYSRGVLGVVAGSTEYPGAGVLTTTSALNTGIGMVRFLGAPSVGATIIDHHAEVVLGTGRLDALVVGPGHPAEENVRRGLETVRGSSAPIVIDAGGLDLVERAGEHPRELTDHPVLLTPHAGELAKLMSRLEGEEVSSAQVSADPLDWAKRAARTTGCLVLLKGPQTVIACPDGYCVLPEPGPSSLATAGSGDVLAGIIAALLAMDFAKDRAESRVGDSSVRDLARQVGVAVLLHNEAGKRSINASQLVESTEDIARELVHGRSRA